MDSRLHACLHAGRPVAHAVQTSLRRVDLDQVLEFRFATVQLLLPSPTLRLAILHQLLLGVLPLLQHLQNVACLIAHLLGRLMCGSSVLSAG